MASAEALLRLLRRVAELPLPLMTRGAAFGRHFAHRALAHVMTLGTSDLRLDHVKAVAAHASRREPGLLDVQAAPVRSVTRALSTTACQSQRDDDRDQQRQRWMTTHRHRLAA